MNCCFRLGQLGTPKQFRVKVKVKAHLHHKPHHLGCSGRDTQYKSDITSDHMLICEYIGYQGYITPRFGYLMKGTIFVSVRSLFWIQT